MNIHDHCLELVHVNMYKIKNEGNPNTVVAERTNFQLCVRPLNHVVIYIFKFIVWRRNYLAVEVRVVHLVE